MTDDTDKAPRLAFNITAGRVEHYSDVVEHMVSQQLYKCQQDGWMPSPAEIEFYRREVTRYAIIRHDLNTAMKLTIKPRQLLKS